jgi:23S rRNA U2552 (ribose-2'-O)-methylase RlmE/FtsJ
MIMVVLTCKGWANPAGDTYFKGRRTKAVTADRKNKTGMFRMMMAVGREMDSFTAAFGVGTTHPRLLDLCMAPGGFVQHFLKQHRQGLVDGITLLEEYGGHEVLIDMNLRNRVNFKFADVAKFAGEIGVEDIPETHTDAQRLQGAWPHAATQTYDIVLCDGQVVHVMTEDEQLRPHGNQCQLSNAQLSIALQRVRPGGTIVALLHQTPKWRTFSLVYQFSKFSNVQLFKPQKSHAVKSSFYMVAKQVRPHAPEALHALNRCRRSWRKCTIEAQLQTPMSEGEGELLSERDVKAILDEFGHSYIKLAEPLWDIQARALENSPWMKDDLGGNVPER